MNDGQELEHIERRIERVERELSELRITVRKIKAGTKARKIRDQEAPKEMELGCKARITNNIRPFQEREGEVVKIN